MAKQYKIEKVNPKFSEITKEIKINRIKMGKDKKLKSTSRITLAMTRHHLFPKIKYDIETADLEEK